MPDGKYVVNVVSNQVQGAAVPYASAVPAANHIALYIILGVIGLFILLTIRKSVFIVKQQTVKIVERMGKYKKTATAGLNFKFPFIDSVVIGISLRIQELKDDVSVKSSDNAFVSVPVKIQYNVNPDKAKESWYSLSNLEEQVKSYMLNIVRSTGSGMTMEQIFQSKDTFEKAVKEELGAKFSGFGIDIVNVLVDNPIPSREVSDAFNRVIASKRLQEAAQNEAEAIRVKMVGTAKAEAESLTLKAAAYVQQRETIAKGMADIIGTDPKVMTEYLIGIDWRDTVREASKNGAMVIVPNNYDGSGIANLKAVIKQ